MKMMKRAYLLLGLAVLAVTACDKLNSDKRVLADDVAGDDRGAKAVIKNVLLNTEIGIALTDTVRFSSPGALAKTMASKDTLYPPDTWHCWASHKFGGDTLTAGYWVRYAPNFNGYLNPFLTDTAYVSHVTVNDSIDKNNARIYISTSNTAFTVSGLRNYINPSATGILLLNGTLQLNIYFAVGKLTTSTNDDLHYYNTYQFTFVNLQVAEGSTRPTGGSVNFTITQNLDPDKDGLNGTIAGDFTISGVLAFSGTSITMTIGSHSYAVTIGTDGSISINPL